MALTKDQAVQRQHFFDRATSAALVTIDSIALASSIHFGTAAKVRDPKELETFRVDFRKKMIRELELRDSPIFIPPIVFQDGKQS